MLFNVLPGSAAIAVNSSMRSMIAMRLICINVSDCAIISGDLSILDVASEKACIASCGTIILLLFDLKAMEMYLAAPSKECTTCEPTRNC